MLGRLNELLLDALASEDPAATLRSAAADDTLTEAERSALAGVDPDGLLLTRRLIQKLRFERLLRGDVALSARWDLDPAGFTERFQRYDAEVPNACFYPADEARAFRAWLGRSGL